LPVAGAEEQLRILEEQTDRRERLRRRRASGIPKGGQLCLERPVIGVEAFRAVAVERDRVLEAGEEVDPPERAFEILERSGEQPGETV
jgi:hypothetical protein